MSDTTIKSLHLRILGKVQGVWYRGWTIEQAIGLGLSGWVRNRADGSVEAVASGPTEAVDELVRRCHDGPPLACVERVVIESCPPPELPGFHKKPTA